MWTISIKPCIQSIFYTERVSYRCECGYLVAYTGTIQPVVCTNCGKRVPDIQLLRKSKEMRALCHCNRENYLEQRYLHIDNIL